MKKRICICVMTLWAIQFFIFFARAGAQELPDSSESYLKPPVSVAEEVTAPRHLNVTLSNLAPGKEVFLNRKREGITPLSYYAKPYYNLGSVQIDWQANRRRSLTTQTATTGLELVGAKDGRAEQIDVPDDITITHPRWSPDGGKLAWFAHTYNNVHLYVSNPESGNSVQVTSSPVLLVFGSPLEWSGDSRYLFTVLVPDNRGEKPQAPSVPAELQVQVTSQDENRLRTFPSLLENRHEEELLEYYTTGQLVRIDVTNHQVEKIGKPAMIQNINASPSGKHLIVRTLQKPLSRIVPVSRFAWKEEVWDLDGNALTELRHREARKGVPDAGEIEDYGRRNIEWRPDGQGLSLLLKEEDDEEKDNCRGDRLMQWLPPFGEEDLHVVYETERDMRSVAYSDGADILFITQRRSGNEHLFAVFTDQPDSTYTIYRYDRSEFYENPGSLRRVQGSLGEASVMLTQDRESVFLSGTEYFEENHEKAPRPFIDKVEIRTGEKERIFQSDEEVYERVTAVLDNELKEIVIERQAADTHPDSWLINPETGEETKLTRNRDYNVAVAGAQRDRFKIRRADGFEFWVEVVLPADWNGERLPGLIWHYPREYSNQESYDESLRRYNKNSYPGVGTRTLDILVTHGYAVIRADWPIAGERGSSNDNFVWSIVQNSTAVVDSVDAKGYIDRHRMAIGGHSYGAFGTVNAMIHTSLFKAGIAGAGNFNRTLTPMGFQRERSDLWRGQDRYLQMSPIFWADRLDGALLMYHGAEDQNVGTWPTNSRRLFHALNGLGKTASLYLYPFEGHGPSAKETLLDMWRRWADWLDYYVKNEGPLETEEEVAAE